MLKPPSIMILALTAWLLVPDVCSHTPVREDPSNGQKSLQPSLQSANTVSDFSPLELGKVLRRIPPVDYVVLFYINHNTDCRNFSHLFSHLYKDVVSEGLKVRFAKFNCQGVDRRLRMCQEYNINLVPTIVYVSSYRLQRDEIPQKAYVRRFLRYLFDETSDIRLANATRFDASNKLLRYLGDIFAYDQLRDWVMLMYNISTINRKVGTREDRARFLRGLWRSLTSWLPR